MAWNPIVPSDIVPIISKSGVYWTAEERIKVKIWIANEYYKGQPYLMTLMLSKFSRRRIRGSKEVCDECFHEFYANGRIDQMIADYTGSSPEEFFVHFIRCYSNHVDSYARKDITRLIHENVGSDQFDPEDKTRDDDTRDALIDFQSKIQKWIEIFKKALESLDPINRIVVIGPYIDKSDQMIEADLKSLGMMMSLGAIRKRRFDVFKKIARAAASLPVPEDDKIKIINLILDILASKNDQYLTDLYNRSLSELGSKGAVQENELLLKEISDV